MDIIRALNDEWKEEHYKKRGYINYVYDGCSDYEEYMKMPLLYIGKEGYITDNDPRNDKNPYIKNENGILTWYCTDQHKEVGPYSGYTTMTSLCIKILKKILGDGDYTINNFAMMDLKKSRDPKDPNEPQAGKPGTGSIERINRFVEEDRNFILREIELLKPDLIICGGTYKCVEKLLGKNREILFDSFSKKSLRKIVRAELEIEMKKMPVTILDMFHFAARLGSFDVITDEIANVYHSLDI